MLVEKEIEFGIALRYFLPLCFVLSFFTFPLVLYLFHWVVSVTLQNLGLWWCWILLVFMQMPALLANLQVHSWYCQLFVLLRRRTISFGQAKDLGVSCGLEWMFLHFLQVSKWFTHVEVYFYSCFCLCSAWGFLLMLPANNSLGWAAGATSTSLLWITLSSSCWSTLT